MRRAQRPMGPARAHTSIDRWVWLSGLVLLATAGVVAGLAAAGPWTRQVVVGVVVVAVAAAACALPVWWARRQVRSQRARGGAPDTSGEAPAAADGAGDDEGLRELIARGAHDLRTPLNTLAGMADTLVRYGEELSPQVRQELYGALQRSTRRVAGWIATLLDVAVEGRSAAPRSVPSALLPLLEEAVTVTHAATVGLDVELVPTDLHVFADPGEVVRAVSNLLANAGHHAGSGTHVVVEARPRDGRVEVAVRDHGVGWGAPTPSANGSSDDRRHAGHGLGLESVRAQVTAWGGELELDNTPGGGATIRFTIPRARPDEEEAAADHEQQWTIAGRESHVRGLHHSQSTQPTQRTQATQRTRQH